MKNLETITKFVGATILGSLLAVNIPYKNVLLNLMSHQINELDLVYVLSHPFKHTLTRGDYTGIRRDVDCVPLDTDLNAIFLGLQDNPLQISEYRPNSARIPLEAKVYDPSCLLDIEITPQDIERTSVGMLEKIRKMSKGDIITLEHKTIQNDTGPCADNFGDCLVNLVSDRNFDPDTPYELVKGSFRENRFGNFTLSLGYDDRGKFLSFYDIWDFEAGKGGAFNDDNLASDLLTKVGTPIYFYKRWYFNEVGITDEVIEEVYERRS